MNLIALAMTFFVCPANCDYYYYDYNPPPEEYDRPPLGHEPIDFDYGSDYEVRFDTVFNPKKSDRLILKHDIALHYIT